MLIKENDRVLVNSNVVPGKELVYGVVQSVYDNIVVVELEDKSLIKCTMEDIKLLRDTEEVYKDVITISIADFEKAVDEVIKPCNFNNLGFLEAGIVSICGSLVGNRLRRKLFGDKADND